MEQGRNDPWGLSMSDGCMPVNSLRLPMVAALFVTGPWLLGHASFIDFKSPKSVPDNSPSICVHCGT